jgi:hypothetical protein
MSAYKNAIARLNSIEKRMDHRDRELDLSRERERARENEVSNAWKVLLDGLLAAIQARQSEGRWKDAERLLTECRRLCDYRSRNPGDMPPKTLADLGL